MMKSQHRKISFYKVAVPLVRFSIKDVKMTKKRKKKEKWLPYPYLASYNTREEINTGA